jgi:hypothetical protein
MGLEEDAEGIIRKLSLANRFDKYGEAHLVGNVVLKTTIKPDIDIQIYSKESDWVQNAQLIIGDFKEDGLNNYIYRDLKQSGKYLVSFSYLYRGTIWTIDITQTEPNDNYLKDAYRFLLDYQGKLTNETTNTILKLKQYFLEKGKLQNSMSYYIYRSVLDDEAKTPENVLAYIESYKDQND